MDGTAHWIVLLILQLVYLIPLWRIFRRTGMGGYWALVSVIPLFGMIVAGVLLSFSRWPALDGMGERGRG